MGSECSFKTSPLATHCLQSRLTLFNSGVYTAVVASLPHETGREKEMDKGKDKRENKNTQ